MSNSDDIETDIVGIDFPRWMAEELEKKAAKFGVTPQELVKMWIAERLEKA